LNRIIGLSLVNRESRRCSDHFLASNPNGFMRHLDVDDGARIRTHVHTRGINPLFHFRVEIRNVPPNASTFPETCAPEFFNVSANAKVSCARETPYIFQYSVTASRSWKETSPQTPMTLSLTVLPANRPE